MIKSCIEFFLEQLGTAKKEKALKYAQELLRSMLQDAIWGYIRFLQEKNKEAIKKIIIQIIKTDSSRKRAISENACFVALELLKKNMIPDNIWTQAIDDILTDEDLLHEIALWAAKIKRRRTLIEGLPNILPKRRIKKERSQEQHRKLQMFMKVILQKIDDIQ